MSTLPAITVELPGGWWHRGRRHQAASLRPLLGVDELFLAETAAPWLPARKVTELLRRCVVQLGPVSPVPAAVIRELTVGDREALLLHLRRLTFGERMSCVLVCPHPACAEKLDLDLRVADLLLPSYAQWEPWYEAILDERETSGRVRFRLPTGADQEAVASLAIGDVETAARELLRRCIEAEPMPEVAFERLPGLMAERDPQAELRLELTCPCCGRGFSSLLDTSAFLFREIGSRAATVYREVHLLASYYHWSERAILRLPVPRRRRYLALRAEALEARAEG